MTDAGWTQLILPTACSPDEPLLLRMAPLIADLRGYVRTWHFFWEPDLWLRFAWASAEDRVAGQAAIGAAMAAFEGPWSFGRYEGDAEHFGETLWPLHEEAFRVGSEMGLALAAADTPPEDRAFHWHRHVHCFSNALVGTWATEARLLLRQARYRGALLAGAEGGDPARVAAFQDAVAAALIAVEDVAHAEAEVLDLWRRRGRPDLVELLHLPPDFHRNPSHGEG